MDTIARLTATEIVEKHKPLLEVLIMDSAEKWGDLDKAISQAARDNKTTKKEVMKQIGMALNKENPDGYVKSLKVMISRAKTKLGTTQKISKERKKGFEALLEKLQKMKLTEAQLTILSSFLRNRTQTSGDSPQQRKPDHLQLTQAGVA